MHYPWWYVPYLTAPMLIGIIAVVHVLVSHYAVGGGLFLAVETGHAYRTGNKDYLAYLRRHARFFVLLTVVFGAITGVGIWWTIGLASPLATGVLIRTFVFGWATEYVFFILEIVSAFIFYYYWGRLSPQIHTIIVWIYGLSAWISLVLITAITGFMLTGFTLDPGHPLQGAISGVPCSTGRRFRRSCPGPAGRSCSVRSTFTCTRRSRSAKAICTSSSNRARPGPRCWGR